MLTIALKGVINCLYYTFIESDFPSIPLFVQVDMLELQVAMGQV